MNPPAPVTSTVQSFHAVSVVIVDGAGNPTQGHEGVKTEGTAAAWSLDIERCGHYKPRNVTAPSRQETALELPAHAPTLAGNEWRYLKECLDSGWVSSAGPFVARFERAVAAYTGARAAVATINGTAALHVALRVIGVQPDDEVLVPALTFVAPVNVVHACGAHPVLLDVDPHTWQLDAGKVERFLAEECVTDAGRCVNQRTGRQVRAILPVHLLGLACEIDRIVALARAHHLRVVEDAAQAVGVRYRGRHVGTFGDAAIFSFNGNKIITAGGGGMVLTNDAAYADAARDLVTSGGDDPSGQIHELIGFNYRLTSLQAAVGLAQLEQLDTFIQRKRHIAACYNTALSAIDGLTLMPVPPHSDPTFWLYTVLLPPTSTRADRDAVLRQLAERGIGAQPLWYPRRGLPADCRCYRVEHAPRLYDRAISLPSSATLREVDVQRCSDTLGAALRGLPASR